MTHTFTIADLRREMSLTQSEFGALIGLTNKATVSLIETGERPVSLPVALKIETLSDGRIDAASLNDDVAAARRACPMGCDGVHAPMITPAPSPASTGQNGEASRDGVAADAAGPSTASRSPSPSQDDGEDLGRARNRTADMQPVDRDGGRANGQPPEGPKGAAVREGVSPGMAGPVASPCNAPTRGPLSPTLSPEGERGISGAAA